MDCPCELPNRSNVADAVSKTHGKIKWPSGQCEALSVSELTIAYARVGDFSLAKIDSLRQCTLLIQGVALNSTIRALSHHWSGRIEPI